MAVRGSESRLDLRVRQLRWEAEHVVSLELESETGDELPAWTPGAHLDLHLPGGLIRQYSLCGSPRDRDRWRIAVLQEPQSRGGSRAVHEILRPGDVVPVVGPRNNFELRDEAHEYLFIAGGIGITPLLPMVEAVARRGATWQIVYGGRSLRSMAFVEELTAYGDRTRIVPQDELGLLPLEQVVGPPRQDVDIYCCGPEPLLRAVAEQCADWPSGALRVERFTRQSQEPGAASADAAFELTLSRSGRTLKVAAHESVLDALEANGIEVPNSCREGICGTCETGVVEGLPDHRDSLLSDAERESNATMMICVGRSRSACLVLDL